MSNLPPPFSDQPSDQPSGQQPFGSQPSSAQPSYPPPPGGAPSPFQAPPPLAPAPKKWFAQKWLGLPVGAWVAVGAAVAVGVVAVVVTSGDDDGSSVSPATTVVATVVPPATSDDAPDDTTEPTITTPATDPAPDTTTVATDFPDPFDEVEEVAGSPDGATGTRDAPVPPGVVADIGGGWRLQVLDVVADGSAAVIAESEFNDPPPAGSTFTLVKVALGYFGVEDPQSGFQPTITGVGSTSSELDTGCGVLPDEIDLFTDVFAGGVVTGNLCFVTAPDDVASLQLYGLGDFFAEEGVFLDATTAPDAATPLATMVGPQPAAASTPRRLAPTPLATPVDLGDGWTMTGPANDITDATMAFNDFNEPPPAGYRFIGLDVVYAFDGAGSSAAYSVTTKAVGDANVELSQECGDFPGAADTFIDLFAGGTTAGTICFVVPVDSPQFVVYAWADFTVDATVFAIS